MRLINTSTLALELFFGEAVPHYAILSHRWNDVEVSIQDLQGGKGEKMAGYLKIQKCCAQAQLDGWQYVWIDSCCIDKTSSAELSEAINSMYSWYKNSQVCYAYLADVRRGENLQEDLRESNWFTRGWTLQELLAPSSVVFFDKDWIDIGTKASMEEQISKITGIEDFVNFDSACIAQKMSWASRRETTRVEDMAYCLLGLFNVNMPPLYGEGNKAFTRLQLEIIKTSDDESIFAWYDDLGITDDPFFRPPLLGLLASSPRQYKFSGEIRRLEPGNDLDSVFESNNSPFSMTNKGLHISLNLIPDKVDPDSFVAPLKCHLSHGKDKQQCCPVIIVDRKVVEGSERYSRSRIQRIGQVWFLKPDELQQGAMTKGYVQKYIYVKGYGDMPASRQPKVSEISSFTINTSQLNHHGFAFRQYYPPQGERGIHIPDIARTDERGFTLGYPWTTFVGYLFVNNETKETIVVVLICERGVAPGLALLTADTDSRLQERTSTSAELQLVPRFTNQNQMWFLRLGDLMRDFQILYPQHREGRAPLDRISRRLKHGKSVSASFKRKRDDSGNEIGVIKVELDARSQTDIQWPAPLWADELLSSFAKQW